MLIHLDRTLSIPMYRQIAMQIQQLVADGVLPTGSRLPPERKLAEMLDVNRTTVLAAYRDLKADGYAASHVGRGTVVMPSQSKSQDAGAESARIIADSFKDTDDGSQWKHLFSKEAGRTRDTLTRDILALAGRPGIISFAAGIPIPDLEPLPELEALLMSMLHEKGHALFHHTPTEGLPSLRESIAKHSLMRGIQASPSEILVLSGSQQGLDLLSRMFLDPGDTVITEEPTFFCARQLFEGRGATVTGIPCDEEGMRIDRLEAWLGRVSPKFIYVMPTFQNPTGRTTSPARRRMLLESANRHGIPIIEDDAYSGLRYEGADIPPLKSLDSQNSVLYLGSFSKVLFMGLRIGWIQAPRAVLRQLAVHRQLSDIHAAAPSQWLVDACLRSGLLERHRMAAVDESRIRRDIMLKALSRHLAGISGVSWNKPEGGLYIWLALPPGLTAQGVSASAARLGVAFVPGHVFSTDGSSSHAIRLNFTYPPAARIEEGVMLLAKAIREALDGIVPDSGRDFTEDPLPIV
jgi:DNA-binding transcriptional MocR family regulator